MVFDGAEIDFLKNVVSDALNWPANSTGQTTLAAGAARTPHATRHTPDRRARQPSEFFTGGLPTRGTC